MTSNLFCFINVCLYILDCYQRWHTACFGDRKVSRPLAHTFYKQHIWPLARSTKWMKTTWLVIDGAIVCKGAELLLPLLL